MATVLEESQVDSEVTPQVGAVTTAQEQDPARRSNRPWSRPAPTTTYKPPAQAPSVEETTDGAYQGQTQQQILDESQKGLISMLEEDNPYMQLARKQGARLAESRGLGGSSLRERAAQGAAIETALPLVQQAGQEASVERQQAQQIAAVKEQQKIDLASREQLAQAEIQHQSNMQAIDVDYKKWLEDVTFKHQGILQGNAQAAGAYSDFSTAAMNILNNPETNTEQKQASIAALKEALSGSLDLIGVTANIDLSKFLPTTYTPPSVTPPAPATPATPVGMVPISAPDSIKQAQQARWQKEADFNRLLYS